MAVFFSVKPPLEVLAYSKKLVNYSTVTYLISLTFNVIFLSASIHSVAFGEFASRTDDEFYYYSLMFAFIDFIVF
tara:strand:- start:189 stop:413 length:225 start_codon:yes stop_codon:yes gene_type:complete